MILTSSNNDLVKKLIAKGLVPNNCISITIQISINEIITLTYETNANKELLNVDLAEELAKCKKTMSPTEEITYLGQQLIATASSDKIRLSKIIERLIEING